MKIIPKYKPETINDTVICIDINMHTHTLSHSIKLTLNKKYTILNVSHNPTNRILILNDSEKQEWYYSYRFISLKEQRKNKILQLSIKTI